jgi:uncharacterized protein (TIGR03083 family)
MAGMEVDEHIAALRLDGGRLAVAAAAAGLDAPVPTCPEWVVRDLVRHQGGVHRWATGVVAGPRTEVWNVELEEVVGTWPADAALVEWFEEGHAALVAALCAASPDLDCWTFLAAPSPLAMWARRQAHETAMHRVDAELAAGGSPTPFTPAFAADGIDELLSCFITRPGRGARSDPAKSLRVHCSDTTESWLVEFTADSVVTTRDGGTADCDVRGQASDLYQAVWNRRPVDDLVIEGDAAVLKTFLNQVQVRWS